MQLHRFVTPSGGELVPGLFEMLWFRWTNAWRKIGRWEARDAADAWTRR